MKSLLSNYGWITVLIIILTILIAAATPMGQMMMNVMFDYTDTLTQKGVEGGLIAPETSFTVTLQNAPEGVLMANKSIASAGDTITVSSVNEEEYFCSGLKLTYNGRTKTIENTSFTMPNDNVVIEPIWGEPEFSKIYFTNFSAAEAAASVVNDSGLIGRPVAEINGENYYVVYDSSECLGYNNGLTHDVYANNPYISRVTVGTSCTSIGDSAFFNNSNLKTVIVSSTVKTIGGAAFYNCKSIDSLSLAAGLNSIGESAFYNCTNLSDTLELPDGLSRVGGSAFAHTGYSNLIFTNSLKSVGGYAFYGTNLDTEFEFPQHITDYNDYSFLI